MVLLHTPVCDLDTPAPNFSLQDVYGKTYARDMVCRSKGLLVVFMCNHCPYVKKILPELVGTLKEIQALGIGCIAISANDEAQYPEDRPELMRSLAEQWQFSFPYCHDVTQDVAKRYGAVCTPDFFGYNAELKLQYRGCFKNPVSQASSLLEAMKEMAKTGRVQQEQYPSMGCSIKWKESESN